MEAFDTFDPFQADSDEDGGDVNAFQEKDEWFSPEAGGFGDFRESEKASKGSSIKKTTIDSIDTNKAMASSSSALETSFEAMDESFESETVDWSFLQATKEPLETVTSGVLAPSDTSSSIFPSAVLQKVASSNLFPKDPMSPGRKKEPETTVHVAIREKSNCMFDDFSDGTSRRIEGSIHVLSREVNKSFCLVVRDPKKHLESFLVASSVCRDVTQKDDCDGNGDRIMLVDLNNKESGEDITVASYVCKTSVRPVPLLVKTKVQLLENDEKCRVGIKIRSNPSNTVPMTQMAVLLAVPPDVQGETVMMSKDGGVWDNMKRIVAWSLNPIVPGEVVDIQCQFDFVVAKDVNRSSPRFPVLVRCDAIDDQFSAIQLSAAYTDDQSNRIEMDLSKSVRIMHRKV